MEENNASRQNTGSESGVQQQNAANSQKEEMVRILTDLKKKMAEIDKITDELDQRRREMEKSSPKKTEKILEEIKVPSLELLK
ncbi:MAG: hypothetical protein AABW59_03845 [archaeon]